MPFDDARQGSTIQVLVCATLTTSLGPTMALKGADGSSMRSAVEGMKDERRRMFWSFVFGTTGFVTCVLSLVWITIDEVAVALVCSVILIICFVAMGWRTRCILERFAAPESSAIAGQGVVTGEEFVRKSQVMLSES